MIPLQNDINVPLCVQCRKFWKSVANAAQFLRKKISIIFGILLNCWECLVLCASVWFTVAIKANEPSNTYWWSFAYSLQRRRNPESDLSPSNAETFITELSTLHFLRFIALLEIIDTIPRIDGGHRGNDFDCFWEIATTCGPPASDWGSQL